MMPCTVGGSPSFIVAGVFLDVWSSLDFLNFVLLFVFRWIYLNDQNLCIPASSSFVYGAVPIGASIYVIGDLDTGKNVNGDFCQDCFLVILGHVLSSLLIL